MKGLDCVCVVDCCPDGTNLYDHAVSDPWALLFTGTEGSKR